MSSTSGRHAREFYGQDQNEEAAADYGEEASNPSGAAVSFSTTSPTASVAVAGSTDIVATVQHGGVNKSGIALTAVSSNVAKATVTASDVTDAGGDAQFTVTGVAVGTCTVTIGYPALGLNRTVAVTVTAE